MYLLKNILLLIHVVSVILWIGGMAFVTFYVLPTAKKINNLTEKISYFEQIENRFAPHAKIYSILVFLSGLGMLLLSRLDLSLFTLNTKGIALTIMFLVGVLWLIVLFILEKIVIHKKLEQMISSLDQDYIDKTFKLIIRFHWFLFILSITAVIGGLISSRNFSF